MQASLAAVELVSSIAARLAGASFLWVVDGVTAGLRYPVHADCDPADLQTIVEPHAGQAVGRNRAATRTLGHVACHEKCWLSGLAILLFLYLAIFAKPL